MSRITVDVTPRHEISPRLYMQFMEPLGTTDSSVEACWDVLKDEWREDFIEVVRDLAPSSIRWGGILTSFWKWRESVGEPAKRPPMFNYLWGGTETNRVGVHEFLDFCEAVGAEPIMAINFAADGRPEYIDTARGEHRAGTPEEAADLVSYCNDPDNAERKANGREKPWNVRTWQIGNETSYPKAGERFTSTENAAHYVEFARAMRARDSSITLIGWGDMERDTHEWWAPELIAAAGNDIDMVALHMMMQRPENEEASSLKGRLYRNDYDRTWSELDAIYKAVEKKLLDARDVVSKANPKLKLAITEGHLSLQPHNKIELLREWISGVYHARCMTLFERHSDIVDICTLADFAGTSWTVNAVLLGSPRERPYLLPVGHVMRLFKTKSGSHAVTAESDSADVVVSASRRGDRIFVHATNLDINKEARIDIDLGGVRAGRITCHRIAPPRLDDAIDSTNLDVFAVSETSIANLAGLTLPAASVSAFEIELA
jgi:alpha-L-arabinofuranosidase